MKRLLFFWTLLAALMLPAMASAQQRTVTVGNWSGTTTSHYTLGSYYHYSYSQSIYSASELGSTPGYIRSLSFDNRATTSLTYDSIKVYIGTCTDTIFASTTSWVSLTGQQLVFADTSFVIPLGGSELTLLLDTPFQYDGNSNIVITIRKWQPSYSSACVMGYTSKTNTLMYRQSDSDTNYANPPSAAGTRSPNRSNMKFILTSGANDPICMNPTGLTVSNITDESATVSWDASTNFTSYNVVVSTTEIDPDTATETPTSTTANSLSLTMLDDNATYHVYLQGICSTGSSTDWIHTSFHTNCLPVAVEELPYTYGFEDADGTTASAHINSCWKKYTSYTTAYPYPSTTHRTGTRSLYFYRNATNYSYAVLPQFEEDLTELQLSFWAYRGTSASYGHYAVGVMTDPADISTFDTLLVGQVNQNSVWELVEVPLSGYTGTGTWLAILSPIGTPVSYLYVDDITVDYIPACPRPTDLVQTDSTSSEATLEWTSTANEFIVEYGLKGFEQGSGDTVLASTPSVTLTGLTMGLTYDVYVTAICSYVDTSTVAHGTVTAGCSAITTDNLPFTETFETYVSGSTYPISTCWTKAAIGTTTNYPYPYSTAAINGSLGLYFYSIKTSSTQSSSWAALPPVDDGLDVSDLMVNFMVKRSSSTTSTSTTTYSCRVMVGVADSVTNLNSAENMAANVDWIDTLNYSDQPASSVHSAEVSFEDYTGTGKYVVFYVPTPDSITTNNYTSVYLDDITLRLIPNCFWPTSVVLDSVTDEMAAISWTPDPRTSSPSYWVVEYGNAGFAAGEGNSTTVYDTTAILTDLLPNHIYEVHVSAVCGSEMSDPALLNIRTACSPVANEDLPYIEDFESYNSGTANPISPCWSRYAINTTTNYPYPSTTAGIGSNIGLYFYGFGSSNIHDYATLPLFESDINDLMVSFYLKRYSTTTSSYHSIMEVGVMGNPNDFSTFEVLETIDLTDSAASTIGHFMVSLEGYTGTGRYITFHAPAPAASHYNYVYLDSVVVEALPSCPWPAGLTVDNVTHQSIEFSFAATESSSHQAVISTGGVDIDSASFSTNSYTFNGLVPQTAYTIRVANICDGERSYWSYVSATTGCSPIDTLPWIETFDSMAVTTSATDIPCWQHMGGGYVNIVGSGTHVFHDKALRFYPSGSLAGNILVLPSFNWPVSELEISMMCKPEGVNSGSFSVGYITNFSDTASFVEVANYPISYFQLTPGATTVSYVEVSNTFAGAPDNARIALRHNVNSTAWYWFVDSIEVHQAPACLAVTNLTADTITTNSIGISFVGTDDNSYGVTIRNAAGTVVDSVTVTTESHTFTGLTANTQYEISVTTICPFGISSATTISARTLCVAIATLPYSEDFESYASGTGSSIDPCWHKGTNHTSTYPFPYSTNAINGQRSLYFYAYRPASTTSTAYYSYAALPAFEEDIQNLMLNFQMRRYSTVSNYYTSRLVIGVMTDPDDIATFTPVDTVDLQGESSLSVHGVEVAFDNYTGTGQYIALYDEVPPLYGTGTYTYSYVYVDDIEVNTIPNCRRPSDVAAISATANTATVGWTSTASSFEIEYGPHGFTQGTGTTVTSNVDSVVITGLSAATVYDVYVRALCSASEASQWSFVRNFSTDCGAISLPVVYNLDAEATGTTAPLPLCWTRVNNSTGTYNYYPYVYNSSTYAHSGNNTLYFYLSTSTGYASDQFIVFPQIDVVNFPMDTREVTFWSRAGSGTHSVKVGVMNSATDTSSFTEVGSVTVGTVMGEYSVPFNGYTGTGSYIALRVQMDATTSYSVYVDDITLGTLSSCPRAYDLTAMNGTPTTVDLAWTDTIGSSQWVVSYAQLGSDSWTEVTASTNPYTLTGLTANTVYRYRVAPICDDGMVADWSRDTYTFNTSQPSPAAMPYSYNFEDATEWANWQTNSNTNVNWYRGNVAEGNTTYAMYLSADSGATHSWNMNTVTNAVAYRDIDFGSTTACYDISFDVYMGGTIDHNYDGIAVLAVDPADYVVAQNAGITSPWGHVNDVAVATVRHDTAWGTYTAHLDGMTGIRRIVFYHFNQATGASYPFEDNPSAIDNISIALQPCQRPYNLTATSVSATSVTLDWAGDNTANYTVAYRVAGASASTNVYLSVTGVHNVVSSLTPNTSYYLWVRRDCTDSLTSAWSDGIAFSTPCLQMTLPFFEDFNGDTATTYSTPGVLPLCWDFYNNGTNANYNPHIVGSGSYWYSPDGTPALTMTSGSATYGNTKIVVLPEFNMAVNGDSVSFYYRYESATNGSLLEIGYVTNPDYASSFVSVAAIPPTTTITLDTVVLEDIPSNATRIAFRWTYSTSFYSVGIDDLRVWGGTPRCPQPANLTADTSSYNSLTFTWQGSDSTEVVLMQGLWDEANIEGAASLVSTTGTATFTGLTYNTQYTVGMRTLCEGGLSGWTLMTVYTADLPCFTPNQPSVSNIGYYSADIAWTVNGIEQAWQVRVYNTTFEKLDTVTVQNYTATGLIPNVTYNVEVSALCGDGYILYSEPSPSVAFTTDSCLAPTGVTASGVTANSAVISWTGTGVDKYEVEYGEQGYSTGEGTRVTVTGGVTTVTLENLEQQNDYDVFVRAYCDETLYSVWSDKVQFTTAAIGIDDVQLGNVALYPNPASASVTLSGIDGEAMVTIIDLNGREVYRANASGSLTVDVSGYAKGAYFVRVTGERTTAIRKLVVK